MRAARIAPRRGKGPVSPDGPVTLAQVEEALAYTAYLVRKHGDAYAPVMDRLIVEVETMRREGTPLERANRVLEAYSAPGSDQAGRP